jgi:hypothetical protein
VTACDGRTGVNHRGALGQGRPARDRLALLGDRQRLTGQGRFVDLEAALLDEAGIGCDAVAFGDQEHVSGHHLLSAAPAR